MDLQQILTYGLTGSDSHELFSPRTYGSSGCSLGPLKFTLTNTPVSSQFNYDTSSVITNIDGHYSSIDSTVWLSAASSSMVETDSWCEASQFHSLKNVKEGSSSFDAVTSESMRHALHEIETVLMAPDIDEEPRSINPKFEENKQPQLTRQRPNKSNYESNLESPVIVEHSHVSDTYKIANADVRPVKRLKEMKAEPGSNVKQLLVRCAEAVSQNNINEFMMLCKEAQGVVSVKGDPIQRLGAYMLEGLVAKHESSGTKIYRSLRCQEPESKELLSYMRILYDICPYFIFGYMAANGAIAEAMRNEDKIHIIDFQIAQGTQWITLIQALATRPGGPPHVRITGIDDPISEYARGDSLQLVGKMFSEMSKQFNIVLEFHALNVYGPQVTREMLDIRPEEALAVNFTFQLHHTPDESIDVSNPRDGLLRMVKGLNPKVMTLVEQESNTNTTSFLTRFIETLDYYSAMFESLDATLPRDSKDRISVEQHCVAKDIVNIIACEGMKRVERHELLGKWRSRLSMAGFKPYPLSSYVNSVIKTLLGSYSDKYTLLEKDGTMLLGWKNRNLISASAWQ